MSENNATATIDATHAVVLGFGNFLYQSGIVQNVGSTSFQIAWTKTNSGTSDWGVHWEATE